MLSLVRAQASNIYGSDFVFSYIRYLRVSEAEAYIGLAVECILEQRHELFRRSRMARDAAIFSHGPVFPYKHVDPKQAKNKSSFSRKK